MPRLSLLAASLLLALGMNGCNGSGSENATASSYRGRLVDDLILGATVYCDQNSNGSLDAGEISTRSDARGEFTLPAGCGGLIATVAGTGIDRTTLRPPAGTYRARPGSAIVSPWTTLQVDSGLDAQSIRPVMMRLGFGDVDPSTFDPTAPAGAIAATAAAKILNDLADIAAASGSDPDVAFHAAARSLAAELSTPPTPADTPAAVLRDPARRSALIHAVALQGLQGVRRWSEAEREQAVRIATASITQAVQDIASVVDPAQAASRIRNTTAAQIIATTPLADAAAVSLAVQSAQAAVQSVDYLYLPAPILSMTRPEGRQDYPIEAFTGAGLDLSGMKLRDLGQLEIPLAATPYGLPVEPTRVSVALVITRPDNAQQLELLVEPVELFRQADGSLVSRLGPDARLHAWGRSITGIELATGANPIALSGLSPVTSQGVSLGLGPQWLQQLLAERFITQNRAVNSLLSQSGQYDIRIVLGGLELRATDASNPWPATPVTLSGLDRTLMGSSLSGHLRL